MEFLRTAFDLPTVQSKSLATGVASGQFWGEPLVRSRSTLSNTVLVHSEYGRMNVYSRVNAPRRRDGGRRGAHVEAGRLVETPRIDAYAVVIATWHGEPHVGSTSR